ncbi:uncharacterized protein LOC128727351 [Anopheles nili]|uniref:uncharacterized protein LOC128727351 n=1 Tax=Anopheles nili TaxID=185578 RepID=UPI00237BD1E0|nr:uncharacterized protein LOC128727351 [Anopheles nili]
MESTDKSEIKIKEKLNLHVKKRLQESSKDVMLDTSDSKDKRSPSVAANCSAGPRAKRQKTKNVSKPAANATVTTAPSLPNAGIRGNDLLLSPGAANSNDTTNSSINSTDQDGELNDRETCEKGSSDKAPKSGQRMDIFSMILNHKKRALMCDPEVIKFMNNLTESRK